MRAGRAAGVLVALLGVTACSGPAPAPSSSTPTRPTAPGGTASGTGGQSVGPSPSATYAVSSPPVWVCRPGLAENPCERDLDTVVQRPDGSRTTRTITAAGTSSFDCFYLYPTVSEETTRNASRKVAPEIVATVRAQAAPFSSVCRVFAPVYRQITRRGLVTGGLADPRARELALGDAVDAFHDYLNRYNDGRPFLLLGHSQGSTTLTSLVQSQIDGDAALRSRMVSAMLIGGAVMVGPDGRRGTFSNIPPCTAPTQTGCVVAYNSYTSTPPESALFGRTNGDRHVVCTNPAALAGGPAPITPVVPAPSGSGAREGVGYLTWPEGLAARCRSNERSTWLEVTRPGGSRVPGTLLNGGSLGPSWGSHRVDVTVALGDLVRLAGTQAAALR